MRALACGLIALAAGTRAFQPYGRRLGTAHIKLKQRPALASTDGTVPSLCVLDLDMCMWSPEMYTLDDFITERLIGDLNGRGDGVIGVRSGADVVTLFPGALQALQEVHDGEHEGMRLAVASSADTPLAELIGRQAMGALEVVPGVSVRDVLCRGFEDGRNLLIGRQPPLSVDKSLSHFPLLQEATGIPYEEMLFFDDSLWSDHCAFVERNCPGVVTQRTPRGMTVKEWRDGLRKYAEKSKQRVACG